MAVGLQLGIDQFVIHRDLKAPPIRGHQGDRLDLRLKLLEQIGCQTDSPVGVVSNYAIDNLYLKHGNLLTSMSVLLKNTPADDATGVIKPASLNRYGLQVWSLSAIPFARITVAAPAGATLEAAQQPTVSRRGSEVHSTQAHGRGFQLLPLSVPPLQRVLVLFTAFHLQLSASIS